MKWQFELKLGSLLCLYHALHAFGLVNEPVLAIDALHPTAKHSSWSFNCWIVGVVMRVFCWIDGKFQVRVISRVSKVTYGGYTV